MSGSNQHCVAYGVGYEVHAAQYECTQKNFTKPSVGLHDLAEGCPAEFKDHARFARPAADQAPPARELIHFPGECPRPKDSDYSLTIVRNTNELATSFEYDEDTVLIVSSIEQDFTGLRVAPCAK